MTTTAPAGLPPGLVDRTGWGGVPFPPQLQNYLLSKMLLGSPFANALAFQPTNRAAVSWPLVSPTPGAWLREGQEYPKANLGDEPYEVAVCKLGNTIGVTWEAVSDASFGLADAVGRALADGVGPEVDQKFLYGDEPLTPKGVWWAATEAEEQPDFRSAAALAWGELLAAGAQSVTLCANPVRIAQEWARVGLDDHPIHADVTGEVLRFGPGITCLPVPMMKPADVLALDTTAVYRVIRSDFAIESNANVGWFNDIVHIKVRGRLAIAAPVPLKSLRRCTITAPEPTAAKAASPPPARK